MSQEQKSLIVNIADKTFKIKIDVEEESHFLDTLKTVNAKIKEFRASYPGLYLQDYLSMALIWLASEQTKQQQQTQQNIEDQFLRTIQQWTNRLPKR